MGVLGEESNVKEVQEALKWQKSCACELVCGPYRDHTPLPRMCGLVCGLHTRPHTQLTGVCGLLCNMCIIHAPQTPPKLTPNPSENGTKLKTKEFDQDIKSTHKERPKCTNLHKKENPKYLSMIRASRAHPILSKEWSCGKVVVPCNSRYVRPKYKWLWLEW